MDFRFKVQMWHWCLTKGSPPLARTTGSTKETAKPGAGRPIFDLQPTFKACLAFPLTQVLLWPLLLEPPGVEGEPCDLAPPAHKLAHRCRGETKLDPWNGSRLSEIFIGRWQQLNPFSRSCLRQRTFSRWHKLKSQILVKKRCYEKAGNLKDLSRRNLRFHCSKYFLGLVCPLRSG